jgi:hypothetical protein
MERAFFRWHVFICLEGAEKVPLDAGASFATLKIRPVQFAATHFWSHCLAEDLACCFSRWLVSEVMLWRLLDSSSPIVWHEISAW